MLDPGQRPSRDPDVREARRKLMQLNSKKVIEPEELIRQREILQRELDEAIKKQESS